MLLRLFLLFTVTPAVELYLLIEVGQRIGAASTVGIILLTGAIGAALARHQGLSVIQQLTDDLKTGLPPGDHLVEALLVLVGAVLLVTPGLLTDAFGFCVLVPLTRKALAPTVRRALMKRVNFRTTFSGAGQRKGPVDPGGNGPATTPFNHPVDDG
jgi:UPF0716 protein FxsA